MNRPKITVHTDVILDYLLHHGEQPSLLRIVMMKFFCYTTVFNAIELFSLARSASEARAVASSMNAMKILGLNAKHAERYGEWFAQQKRPSSMNLLIAGICLESKLPLLTGTPEVFGGARGLIVVKSAFIRDRSSAAEILSHARVM